MHFSIFELDPALTTPKDLLHCNKPAADAGNPNPLSYQHGRQASRQYLKCKGHDSCRAELRAHRRQARWDDGTQTRREFRGASDRESFPGAASPFSCSEAVGKEPHLNGFPEPKLSPANT